jgi:hypothetical protein
VAELNTDIALIAGKLKESLGLALYVIATAKYVNAKTLLLKVEKKIKTS